MPGHLFVIKGDLMRLACDAWALPCDVGFSVTAAWATDERSPLRRVVDADLRVAVDAPHGWGDQGVRILALPGSADPQVWLVNTGGLENTRVDWYLGGLEQFVDAISGVEPARGRPRPLVGVPFVGSGQGGQALARGGLLDHLLEGLAAAAGHRGIDIALVLRSPEAFAAAQSLRRREPSRYWHDLPSEYLPAIGELSEHALAGRLVLFLGAGASVGAGLPTWKGLLDELASDAGITGGAVDLERLNDLDRARLIERRLTDHGDDLRAAILKHIEHASRYSLTHALLACLPSNEAVTTNYDQLFEAAMRGAGRPISILPYESVSAHSSRLLKMHGSVEHPEDLVLTREDYLRYADRRGALAGIVQALLITRRLLFVGFSLADDNFDRIADDVRKAVRGPTAHDRSPFATALILDDNPALVELWRGDVDCRQIGRPEDSIGERARIQEVLLDRLLAESTTARRHLLDASYNDALTPTEQALASSLRAFVTTVPDEARHAPEWRLVAELLRDLGLDERMSRSSWIFGGGGPGVTAMRR